MPTYEYRCSKCEHELEEFQSITAKPLRKCPACGKNTLKRLIGTGAGVLFKGAGFWQTDYARSGEYKKSAEADAKPAESKTAESKPAETKSGESKSSESKSDSSAAKPAEPKAQRPKAEKPRSDKKPKKAG